MYTGGRKVEIRASTLDEKSGMQAQARRGEQERTKENDVKYIKKGTRPKIL
jgi:hypothetical protein